MKNATFTVTLTFKGDVNKKHLREIAENIMDGLQRQAEEVGITPDDSEGYTIGICIEADGMDAVIKKSPEYNS